MEPNKMMTPEYLKFKAKVEKQRRVVANKQALVTKQQDILKDILADCPHEEVEVESSYFPGGYLEKAYTVYWNKCTLCGVTGPETTDQHNYYG